jgi:hypothetical protein
VCPAAQHARCYSNHADGIAAVRAGTYGIWAGHQWVCPCPCGEVHAFAPCPHADHQGQQRRSVEVDHDVRQTLFYGRLGRLDGNSSMLSPARLGSPGVQSQSTDGSETLAVLGLSAPLGLGGSIVGERLTIDREAGR